MLPSCRRSATCCPCFRHRVAWLVPTTLLLLQPQFRQQAPIPGQMPERRSMMTMAAAQGTGGAEEELRFGPYKLYGSQVFYRSKFSLGIVNLKPIVPGHVLIISKRVVPRLTELTQEEVTDLFLSAHYVGPVLEKHYGGEALTVSMQDGVAAGQSVPHVHVHLLPRKPGDFKRNDQVYDELDGQCLDRTLDLDEDRRPRSKQEMAQEAAELRQLFPQNQQQ